MDMAPEYLYHYTNIETLALILKNRTIRFNSLDKVDDLQENMTADIKNAGQFIYVSSWASEDTENALMWNMYATFDHGVRIRLPKGPFKIHENTVEDVSKVSCFPVISNKPGAPMRSLIPVSEMLSEQYFIVQAMLQDSKKLLHEVIYTDDPNLLVPAIFRQENGKTYLDFGKLGRYKNNAWKDQKEWRYIINVYPITINQYISITAQQVQEMCLRMYKGIEKQPIPYYDMTLADESFSKMQITLGPRLNTEEKKKVEKLVAEYNPSAEMKQSMLQGIV